MTKPRPLKSAPTLEDILGRGMFPRELPPIFSSVAFSKFVGAKSVPMNDWMGDPKIDTQCAVHHHGRPGQLPRRLGIPNPFAYARLAELVVQNWERFTIHWGSSRVALSRPTPFADLHGRAIQPRVRYAELSRLLHARSSRSRYLLKADITQFYSSIYTHALEWALDGKAAAKSARGLKKAPGSFGQSLDKAVRRVQWGETAGVPIGPDCSLVLAETLLRGADRVLEQHAGSFRYVDDFYVLCDSIREAETAKQALASELGQYHLQLHPDKTRIVAVPTSFEEPWVFALRHQILRVGKGRRLQSRDLAGLLAVCVQQASANPKSPVFRFALTRIWRLLPQLEVTSSIVHFAFHTANAEPSSLPKVIELLIALQVRGGGLQEPDQLREFFEATATRLFDTGLSNELAWVLWGALVLRINLSADAAKSLSQTSNTACRLLCLLLRQADLLPSQNLDTTVWEQDIGADDVFDGPHWLLAYEAGRQAWLPARSPEKGGPFATIAKSEISFLTDVVASAADPDMPGGGLSDFYS